MTSLTKNETGYIDQYHKTGVLFPFRVLTGDETAEFRKEFELVEHAFGGQLSYAGNMHLSLAWAFDLVMQPAILDHVAPLLGGEVAVNGSLMLTKYPKTNNYVSWHQDGINSKWNEEHSLTVWFALSNSNNQNGCMRVIPGSHKESKQDHVFFNDDKNMLRNSHKITSAIDESKAIDLDLLAGEISIHHDNIVHGSGVNNSLTKRIGFAIRYTNPNYSGSNGPVVYARVVGDRPIAKTIVRPAEFRQKYNALLYREFLEKNIVLK